MDKIIDGGAAFPIHRKALIGNKENGYQEFQISEGGMSLRDWFAGMALQGMCAGITGLRVDGIIINRPQDISELAYCYADAMLKERES